jgi:hypothetical protein
MKSTLVYSVLCVASTLLIGWRIHAIHNRETEHFEIVEDLSLSHPNGCESLLGLSERVLRSDGVSPESTLAILVVGDAATANEPWQLGRYVIPSARKVIEGRKGSLTQQQRVLRDISDKCRMARRTNVSPVFLAVKQAVADLRAQGCKETSRCQLFVDSDLEENAEGSIKKNLDNLHYHKDAFPHIDNTGIAVEFCGLAEVHRTNTSTVLRSSAREDHLRQLWRSLFIKRETIGFGPFCPTIS